MNDARLLLEQVKQEFPDTTVKAYLSLSHPFGWGFCVSRPGRPKVTIQWSADRGFGLCYRNVMFSEAGPDEIRVHRFSAMQRIRELLD